MTEIQEAFEKHMIKEKGYSLEHWNDNWPQPDLDNHRFYSSIVTESDFRLFRTGWISAKADELEENV